MHSTSLLTATRTVSPPFPRYNLPDSTNGRISLQKIKFQSKCKKSLLYYTVSG